MRGRSHRWAGGAGLARLALWAAIAVLAVGGAVVSGCDIGGDDDDEPAATTPATTETTGPTGPSGDRDGGGEDGGGTTDGTGGTGGVGTGEVGTDPTPEDTGPIVPESGGVGADEYDPEADSPENDLPPPPGSPQEKFEQFCDENPSACE